MRASNIAIRLLKRCSCFTLVLIAACNGSNPACPPTGEIDLSISISGDALEFEANYHQMELEGGTYFSFVPKQRSLDTLVVPFVQQFAPVDLDSLYLIALYLEFDPTTQNTLHDSMIHAFGYYAVEGERLNHELYMRSPESEVLAHRADQDTTIGFITSTTVNDLLTRVVFPDTDRKSHLLVFGPNAVGFKQMIERNVRKGR